MSYVIVLCDYLGIVVEIIPPVLVPVCILLQCGEIFVFKDKTIQWRLE